MRNYEAWRVSPADFPGSGSQQQQLEFICRYGLIAPSVHNTQPWQLAVTNDTVTVTADSARLLKHGDPTGRETWLSLAACVENLVQASTAFGFDVTTSSDYDQPTVELKFKPGGNKKDQAILAAMVQRTSNRRPFSKQPIEAQQLRTIAASWSSPNVLIKAVSDRAAIELVATLTGRAIGLALSLPQFRTELAELMRPSWTSRPDGLTGAALQINPLRSLIEPLRFRYWPVADAEAAVERQRMQNSGGLVLVFSRGDMPPFWLEAGRAYQRTAIAASQLGLAQSTTAAVVEAPDFHTEIEHYFKTDWRLQTVMRIGHGQSAPHSPRRQLADVVTSTSKLGS